MKYFFLLLLALSHSAFADDSVIARWNCGMRTPVFVKGDGPFICGDNAISIEKRLKVNGQTVYVMLSTFVDGPGDHTPQEVGRFTTATFATVNVRRNTYVMSDKGYYLLESLEDRAEDGLTQGNLYLIDAPGFEKRVCDREK